MAEFPDFLNVNDARGAQKGFRFLFGTSDRGLLIPPFPSSDIWEDGNLFMRRTEVDTYLVISREARDYSAATS